MEVMRLTTMRRATVMISAAALGPVLITSACAMAVASPVTDGWGIAITVPGTAAINTGAAAGVGSISCASPGDCSAVGTYATPPGDYHGEVFVVSQVRGRWHKAIELPGLAALDNRRDASSGSVSCSSPGNCGTGGAYRDGHGHLQAYVASQVRGTWGKAIEVPGTATLNVGGFATTGAVSCPSPGDCAAGGSYSSHSFRKQAFVVSEAHGTWGKAIEVPGTATLNTHHNATVDSISCSSPGNCTAVGTYETNEPSVQTFVVSEVNGTWGEAQEAPGTAALDSGGDALAAGLSCTSPGDCTAIGTYDEPNGLQLPFVISQVNGTWDIATQIPGMTAFNKFGAGYGYSVSCTSPGNCVAGGSEGADNGYDVGGGGQPFVVTQTNGTWGDAQLVPGMKGQLNSGADGAASAVSCASQGNCVAAGYYGIGKPGQKVYNLEVFVADEVKGTWGKAIEIPGTAGLNSSHWAGIGALSCAAPGVCVVGGSYTGSDGGQAFVDSRT